MAVDYDCSHEYLQPTVNPAFYEYQSSIFDQSAKMSGELPYELAMALTFSSVGRNVK